MADRQCPACKMIIDASAQVCPYCKKKIGLSWLKEIFLVVLLIGILVYFIGNFRNYQEGAASLERVPVVLSISAPQLLAEYERDGAAADAKYKGHLLVVSGHIDSIGKDIAGVPYVTLGTGTFVTSVQCRLINKDEPILAKQHPGQQITVIGECRGKQGDLYLDNCSIRP